MAAEGAGKAETAGASKAEDGAGQRTVERVAAAVAADIAAVADVAHLIACVVDKRLRLRHVQARESRRLWP
eukprot:6167021-Pleurochrysis_carterae.AAC.1